MPTEIHNSNKDAFLPRNILSIKDSESNDYEIFKDVNEKIILNKVNNYKNNMIHKIDLKLSGNTIYKVDVYKAVIKFEVEQM